MLPGAADDGLEPVRVVAADGVVQDDQAPTASQVGLQVRALLPMDRAAFRRVHHEHVRLRELGARGEIEGAVHRRAAA